MVVSPFDISITGTFILGMAFDFVNISFPVWWLMPDGWNGLARKNARVSVNGAFVVTFRCL